MTNALPRLRVSSNGRFLMTEEGAPFFWLGDTAWELFHRLDREEAAHYFATRARQGFNLVQAVALAEFNGLGEPNRYGELPLIDRDPSRPNPAYFTIVDEYIAMAAAQGLYMALLPTWADKVAHGLWGNPDDVVFTVENARAYGGWLGARYREHSNIVWVIGGDRPAVHDPYDDRPIWRAMAEGIREHIPGALMTYHPNGGDTSSHFLHEESWLDFNMMQSGHGGGRDVPVWDMITADYARTPIKPVLDGEPNYEDHPVSPWPTWDPANGHFRDYDVRKQCYRSVFAGACGVTYGHHSIWQFCGERFPSINHTEMDWRSALTRPGAEQIGHLRRLIETRPFFSRVPAQHLIVGEVGEGAAHIRVTADSEGSSVLAYMPNAGQQITLDLSGVLSSEVFAAWYNPRSGERTPIGQFQPGIHSFTSPSEGPDWVLIVEDSGSDIQDSA
jgi:hypothetical protein